MVRLERNNTGVFICYRFVDIGNRSNQPIEIERGVRKAGKSTEL